MASFVYGLCAFTSLMCAFLLMRGYLRTRSAILFWSGLCFIGLTLSNAVLILDKLVFPDIDLSPWRGWSTLASLCLLVYGLINAKD